LTLKNDSTTTQPVRVFDANAGQLRFAVVRPDREGPHDGCNLALLHQRWLHHSTAGTGEDGKDHSDAEGGYVPERPVGMPRFRDDSINVASTITPSTITVFIVTNVVKSAPLQDKSGRSSEPVVVA
ncbi:MAG TPA: hypothetical protein VKQ07_08375, partial [Jatrophihabitantaceae bacterium]|nr:hypothetical protein [Jatrophihabitantaceae bacterium]